MTRVEKAPAMPLYGKDAWSDERFAALPWDVQGLFWRLAYWQWIEGSIPADINLVVAITGKPRETRRMWTKIREFFVAHPTDKGRLYNRRLDEHRTKMLEKRQLHQYGADKTNDKLWGGRTGDATRGVRLGDARRRGRHSVEEWQQLLAAAHGRCVKCLGQVPWLAKDHITPLALGGSDAIENLQPLCDHCNLSKGNDATDYRATFEHRLASQNIDALLSDSDRLALNSVVASHAHACVATADTDSPVGSDKDVGESRGETPEKPLTPQQEAVKRVLDALEEHTTGFLLPSGGRIAKWIAVYGVDIVIDAIRDEGVKGSLDGRNPSYLQQCIDSRKWRGNESGKRSSGSGRVTAIAERKPTAADFGMRSLADVLAAKKK